MTDLRLRSKLIRLAYRKPELRSDLIPLLTRTAGDDASLTPKELIKIITDLFDLKGNSADYKKAVELWEKHKHELDNARIYLRLANLVLGAPKYFGIIKPPAHMKFNDWGEALEAFVELMGGLDQFQDTEDLQSQFFDQ